MFSTAQQSYIDSLLPTFAKDGYKYYVVYTNSLYSGSYYGSTNPDLYFVLSKKSIKAKNGYSYTLESDSIFVSCRTVNYSSSNSANNGNRITVEDYTGNTLNIESYEHIYTNAEFSGVSLQPDIYLSSRGLNNAYQQVISFSLLFIFAFVLLKRLWFKRFGRFR